MVWLGTLTIDVSNLIGTIKVAVEIRVKDFQYGGRNVKQWGQMGASTYIKTILS